MPKPEDVAEFDSLIAEILAEGDAVVTEEVPSSPAVVESLEQSRELIVQNLIEAPIPVQPVKAVEQPKYRTIEDKVDIEGAPFQSVVYPLGYVRARWPNFRFDNKAAWYLEEVEALEGFFASPDYQAWKSAAMAAGLRKRGTKKEG
jgi:hypothetical protein